MVNNNHETTKVVKAIPEPTLRRIPMYYQYLKTAEQRDQKFISCTEISEDLHLVPIQVRKDLAMAGAVGRPKVGYSVKQLLRDLEEFLGWHNNLDAFLVGTGSLGSAILGYSGFIEYGLNIIAGFDQDPDKVGTEIHGKTIFPMEKLPDLLRRMQVKIGILTVPAEAAQALADEMIAAGVKGIWNFSPVKIKAAPGVIVQNENLAASLAVLSKKISLADEGGRQRKQTKSQTLEEEGECS